MKNRPRSLTDGYSYPPVTTLFPHTQLILMPAVGARLKVGTLLLAAYSTLNPILRYKGQAGRGGMENGYGGWRVHGRRFSYVWLDPLSVRSTLLFWFVASPHFLSTNPAPESVAVVLWYTFEFHDWRPSDCSENSLTLLFGSQQSSISQFTDHGYFDPLEPRWQRQCKPSGPVHFANLSNPGQLLQLPTFSSCECHFPCPLCLLAMLLSIASCLVQALCWLYHSDGQWLYLGSAWLCREDNELA